MLTLKIVPPVEYRVDQTPPPGKWNYIPLYRMTLDDIIQWQVGFDGYSQLHVTLNGNTTYIPTTPERAVVQARLLYCEQFHKGYRPPGPSTPSYTDAMKGTVYQDTTNVTWPVYTQPKINGIRMLCQEKLPGVLTYRSSANNAFTHLGHLEQELKQFMAYLPCYATLDGELYNHTMDFATLTSAIRTVKKQHEKLPLIQYWIFDIIYEDMEGTPYETRYALLVNAFRKYIQDRSTEHREDDTTVLPRMFTIVPSQIACSNTDIVVQHKQHVRSGYEGIILRQIAYGSASSSLRYKNSLYKGGKSSRILKYKAFIDEEVTITTLPDHQCILDELHHYESRQINQSKPRNITNEDPKEDEDYDDDDDDEYDDSEGDFELDTIRLTVRDDRGNEYDVSLSSNKDEILHWCTNPETIIGKRLTIKYTKILRNNLPFRPKAVAIRDYE
jgi:hypothetical protein